MIGARGPLAVTMAVLLGAIGLEVWFAPAPNAARSAAHGVQAPIAARHARVRDETASYAATALARPLFSQTRRPAPRQGDDAPPSQRDGLPRLSGIVITAAERLAIFQPDGGRGDAAPIVGGQGTRVGAYTVIGVTLDGVTLRGPAGTQTLGVSFAPAGSGPVSGFAPQPFQPNLINQLNEAPPAATALPKPPTLAGLLARLPKPPK